MIANHEEVNQLIIKYQNGNEEVLNKICQLCEEYLIKSSAKLAKQFNIEQEDVLSIHYIQLIMVIKKINTNPYNFYRMLKLIYFKSKSEIFNSMLNFKFSGTSVNDFDRIKKFISNFETDNKRKPTNEEIKNKLNVDECRINQSKDIISLKRAYLSENSIVEYDLDKKTYLTQMIEHLESKLNKRELLILFGYYGIKTSKKSTKEIAEEIGYCENHTKVLKKKLLYKLNKNKIYRYVD